MHNAITWYMTRQDLGRGICKTGAIWIPMHNAIPGLRPAEIMDSALFRLRSSGARSSRTNSCAPLKCLNLYLVFNNRRWSQTDASLTIRGRFFFWFGMNLPRRLQSASSIFQPTANSKACLTRFSVSSRLQLSGTPNMTTLRERSIGLVLTLAPKPVDNPVETKSGPLEQPVWTEGGLDSKTFVTL